MQSLFFIEHMPSRSQLLYSATRDVHRKYLDEVGGANINGLPYTEGQLAELFPKMCCEASAVQAHMKQGIPMASG